jgi:putative addiction module killer protein
MKHRVYQIWRAPEFSNWFESETEKSKVQIDDRLSKIQDEGYFGIHKPVGDDDVVWELKWKNGRRVYYAIIPEKKVLILLGGNKNGQNKDIHKAESLFEKYTE